MLLRSVVEGVEFLLEVVQEPKRERIELGSRFEGIAVEEVGVAEEAVACCVDFCEALHSVLRDAPCKPRETLDEGQEGEGF